MKRANFWAVVRPALLFSAAALSSCQKEEVDVATAAKAEAHSQLSTSNKEARTIDFDDDFESYRTGGYNQPLAKWRAGEVNTPYALSVVTDVSGRLGKVARFEYRNTDVKAPYKTVKADLAGYGVEGETEQYLGFDVNLKDVRAVSKKSVLFFQYHAGLRGFPPFFQLVVDEDAGKQYVQAKVNYYPDGRKENRQREEKNLITAPSGWIRVVVYAKFRANNSGQFIVYIDGREQYRFDGMTTVPGGNPYPRIGIYQPNDDMRTSDYAPVNVVYADNFKMGASLESVQ